MLERETIATICLRCKHGSIRRNVQNYTVEPLSVGWVDVRPRGCNVLIIGSFEFIINVYTAIIYCIIFINIEIVFSTIENPLQA
jgi:hypothetical protein